VKGRHHPYNQAARGGGNPTKMPKGGSVGGAGLRHQHIQKVKGKRTKGERRGGWPREKFSSSFDAVMLSAGVTFLEENAEKFRTSEIR